MKVAVTTFYTNSYKSLSDITTDNLIKYCQKHNYYLDINILNDSDGFHFKKTKHCRKLIDEFDLVWAVENDILLTNHTIPIESFTQYGTYLTLCKDINGYNGGSFLIRKSQWSKDLLDLINLCEKLYGDEQNFMEDWFDSDMFSTIIGVLKHPSINSIPYSLYYAPSYGKIGYREGEIVEMPTHEQGNWVKGDFLMHLPGQTFHRRLEIFQNHLKDIIYE